MFKEDYVNNVNALENTYIGPVFWWRFSGERCYLSLLDPTRDATRHAIA